MQHTPSDSHESRSPEVVAHAETVRARHEAARLIAARRYWQRTKRNATGHFRDTLEQHGDLAR